MVLHRVIPANEAWLACHPGELCAIAQRWFQVMRKCGDEVRELLHDGCPVTCFGDVPRLRRQLHVACQHRIFSGASLPVPPASRQGQIHAPRQDATPHTDTRSNPHENSSSWPLRYQVPGRKRLTMISGQTPPQPCQCRSANPNLIAQALSLRPPPAT